MAASAYMPFMQMMVPAQQEEMTGMYMMGQTVPFEQMMNLPHPQNQE